MPDKKRHDIAAKLDALVRQLKSTPDRKGPRRRGRPDTKIRSGFVRLETWIDPAVHDALARLADRVEVQTGKSTRRSDIVREALREHLQKHLPDGGF